MTDTNTGETRSDVAAQNGSDEAPQMDELQLLKGRASMMGLTFSNNIGVDTLRQKIADHIEGKPEIPEGPAPAPETMVNALLAGATGDVAPQREMTLREFVHEENMKLIRCRITNLDPKKKDLPGEIITVANEYLGTVRKFVPFGEHTDEGYHIPYCIYMMLRDRKFLHISTSRDRRSGTPIVHQRWAPEFSLEVMEPLTKAELNQLAQAQIAAGSVDPNAA